MSSGEISITIDPNDQESIRRALNTEWLLTNGLGGYAMGTVLGVNTRRYHGLLVAATKPPVGRVVALHSMIEQLVIPKDDGAEEVIDLWTQQFGENEHLHAGGYQLLREVHVNPPDSVTWHFEIRGSRLTRSLSFRGVRNSIQIRYQLDDRTLPAAMRIRPIVGLRDFHSLGSPVPRIVPTPECCDDYVTLSTDHGEVAIGWDQGHWHSDAQIWRQFSYLQDRRRGQEFSENLWSPGYLQSSTIPDRVISVLIDHVGPNRVTSMNAEGPRRRRFARAATKSSSAFQLTRAADGFVVYRHLGDDAWSQSVIAGYPWFGDWGRDTMIALPGLMLCTGRLDDARSCLMMFTRHIRNGLIPNVFDDYGGGIAGAHYNTVDAPLWFVHAVREWWKAPGRSPGLKDSIGACLHACREIIAAYRSGTDFNIRMDDDGLIAAGDEGSQLTWMDAKRDGVVFTPRHGKAVEINALWHNALHCMAEMTDDDKERRDLVALSEKVAASFRAQFWWEEQQCLHDVLRPHSSDGASVGAGFSPDGKLRPNQIFAVSLPYSPLNDDQTRAVVKIVGGRLLTPFGLRTLDRDDPDYRGRYEGNLFERDRAYHNGTVWPWLIGPYCEALLRVNKFSDNAKQKVRAIIQPLIDEMNNTEGGRCLGQIAEVYDGDPPHNPGGCPAQAWSVAEVLRITTLIGV